MEIYLSLAYMFCCKTKQDRFKRMFNAVVDRYAVLQLQPAGPTNVPRDFEAAVHQASLVVFPGAAINGRLHHLTQVNNFQTKKHVLAYQSVVGLVNPCLQKATASQCLFVPMQKFRPGIDQQLTRRIVRIGKLHVYLQKQFQPLRYSAAFILKETRIVIVKFEYRRSSAGSHMACVQPNLDSGNIVQLISHPQ